MGKAHQCSPRFRSDLSALKFLHMKAIIRMHAVSKNVCKGSSQSLDKMGIQRGGKDHLCSQGDHSDPVGLRLLQKKHL